MYLLGYISKDNRLYLGDKELNVVSYSLSLSVLEYQTAVMREDFDAAMRILPSIPKEQRTRVAHFLEKQGFLSQALEVSTDPEHKFDLSLQLKDTETALKLAVDAQSEHKWKQLAELAMSLCRFDLTQECLHNASDYPGLLLLATSSGNETMVQKLGEKAEAARSHNVAFLSYFILGQKEKALQLLIDTNRLAEAALFARTYLPSKIHHVIKLWKEHIANSSRNEKSAQALADPLEYENLFPSYQDSIMAEQYLKQEEASKPKAFAREYLNLPRIEERNPLEESKIARDQGTFTPKETNDIPEETIPPSNDLLLLDDPNFDDYE